MWVYTHAIIACVPVCAYIICPHILYVRKCMLYMHARELLYATILIPCIGWRNIMWAIYNVLIYYILVQPHFCIQCARLKCRILRGRGHKVYVRTLCVHAGTPPPLCVRRRLCVQCEYYNYMHIYDICIVYIFAHSLSCDIV